MLIYGLVCKININKNHLKPSRNQSGCLEQVDVEDSLVLCPDVGGVNLILHQLHSEYLCSEWCQVVALGPYELLGTYFGVTDQPATHGCLLTVVTACLQRVKYYG